MCKGGVCEGGVCKGGVYKGGVCIGVKILPQLPQPSPQL